MLIVEPRQLISLGLVFMFLSTMSEILRKLQGHQKLLRRGYEFLEVI